jgi:hypothetical protein
MAVHTARYGHDASAGGLDDNGVAESSRRRERVVGAEWRTQLRSRHQPQIMLNAQPAAFFASSAPFFALPLASADLALNAITWTNTGKKHGMSISRSSWRKSQMQAPRHHIGIESGTRRIFAIMSHGALQTRRR